MFPRSGGYVDELNILADGVAKPVFGGAGVRVLAYFDAAASGSVTLTVTGGEDIVITCPSGGGKVLLERGATEMYGVSEITLDETSLTGTAQISLY